jgi:hypothetical protein
MEEKSKVEWRSGMEGRCRLGEETGWRGKVELIYM